MRVGRWRRRWDSNPRGLSPYLISSQGRYDHFDTPPGVFHPKIVSRKKERTFGEKRELCPTFARGHPESLINQRFPKRECRVNGSISSQGRDSRFDPASPATSIIAHGNQFVKENKGPAAATGRQGKDRKAHGSAGKGAAAEKTAAAPADCSEKGSPAFQPSP